MPDAQRASKLFEGMVTDQMKTSDSMPRVGLLREFPSPGEDGLEHLFREPLREAVLHHGVLRAIP